MFKSFSDDRVWFSRIESNDDSMKTANVESTWLIGKHNKMSSKDLAKRGVAIWTVNWLITSFSKWSSVQFAIRGESIG